MKRHEALYPLSHHHHHALVAALNLKRAGTEKNQLSLDEIKKDLQHFWEHGGQEHFREEEEILLPVYAQHSSVDLPEISEMLMEHVKIRALVKTVLESTEGHIVRMHELGKMLESHVRKEERVIFPMIENALPEEVLQKMAPYLHMKSLISIKKNNR